MPIIWLTTDFQDEASRNQLEKIAIARLIALLPGDVFPGGAGGGSGVWSGQSISVVIEDSDWLCGAGFQTGLGLWWWY